MLRNATGKSASPNCAARSAASSSAFPVCEAHNTTSGARSGAGLGARVSIGGSSTAGTAVDSGVSVRAKSPASRPSTHSRVLESNGALWGRVGTPAVRRPESERSPFISPAR